ncbi:MAG: hypothetical protein V4635_05215 [Bacteroidota bacterium]
MKFSIIIALCAGLVFFSCKKSETKPPAEPELVTTELRNGFPDNANLINGYFFASVKKYHSNPGNVDTRTYCVLNDPAKNLLGTYEHFNDNILFNGGAGNVAVGNVSFNDVSLKTSNFGNAMSYSQAGNYASTPGSAVWKTDGNGSFKALNLTISRGFPVLVNTYTNTFQSYTVSISNGYQVELGNNVSNYDSLVVALTFSGKMVKKRLTAGAASVFFSSSELSIFTNYYSGLLTIYAYNYSTKMVENINYLFELSNKLQVNTQVVP